MTIAAFLCFGVLLVATRNVFQAFASILCVGVVILSVLSIEFHMGWEIGSAESLSMVMLIGFSVDYVVHLSSDFTHSAYKSRNDKMK